MPADMFGSVLQVEEITAKLAMALQITGPFNMQLIAKDGEVKVRDESIFICMIMCVCVLYI